MSAPPEPHAPDQTAAQAEVQKLFLRHSGAIKSFILALLRNPSLAEDVLQETFLVVSAKADSFRLGTNFVAWACTIARFKVLEAVRKNAHEPCLLSPEVIEVLAAASPEEDEREQELRHLETCLTELTQRAREIIRLRYFHSLVLEEIGRRLSLTTDSVYVTLSRARKALRLCVAAKVSRQS
jgi:RNA polymerase sigma-70 factor (ECF subfamily)